MNGRGVSIEVHDSEARFTNLADSVTDTLDPDRLHRGQNSEEYLACHHDVMYVRMPDGNRPPFQDYMTLDLTISTHKKSAGWNITGFIRNIFNAGVRETSPFTTPFINLANDMPQAGRLAF
ncbi:hypothetical protein [Undibacterium sp. TJN19]|uniref:hypothetical protein n=1 Tax=Undibacterium sp. TJN19 TaxID=3413055 RepID=UPI003BF30380